MERGELLIPLKIHCCFSVMCFCGCVQVCACEFIPLEARRGHWTSWSRSYSWAKDMHARNWTWILAGTVCIPKPWASSAAQREVSYCSPNGRKLHPEHCWPCLPWSHFHSCSHIKIVLKVTCVPLKSGLNMNITVNSFMFTDHQCAFSRESGLNTVIVLSPKISGDLKILSPEVLAWTGIQYVILLLPSLSSFLLSYPTLSPSLSSGCFSVSPPSCRSFTWSRLSIIFTKTGSGLNIWRN